MKKITCYKVLFSCLFFLCTQITHADLIHSQQSNDQAVTPIDPFAHDLELTNEPSLVTKGFSFFDSGFVETQKFKSQSTVSEDQFGMRLELTNQGTRAIVGAPFSDSNMGAAYIYERINGQFTEVQKLVPNESESELFFGSSIAIDGDIAVVGAVADENNYGAAYIFRLRNQNWVQEAKLVGSDTLAGDLFGNAMKLHDNRLVITAPNCCVSGIGKAYIFEYDGVNWIEVAKLSASNGSLGNKFGSSVDINNDVIAIGARNQGLMSRGSVYIFQKQGLTWIETQEIRPTNDLRVRGFGYSVAFANNELFIGDPNDTSFSSDSGAVHIFMSNASGIWFPLTKIYSIPPIPLSLFGGMNQGISVDGDLAVISSPEFSDVAINNGSIFVLKRIDNSWRQIGFLTADDAGTDWRFGTSVAIQNDRILVGAIGADGNSGAVYSFTKDLIFTDEFD